MNQRQAVERFGVQVIIELARKPLIKVEVKSKYNHVYGSIVKVHDGYLHQRFSIPDYIPLNDVPISVINLNSEYLLNPGDDESPPDYDIERAAVKETRK